MVNVVVRFWKRRGEAAGGDSAVMSFGLMKRGSICCRWEHSKWIRRCAWTWQGGYKRWGGLGLTGGF
jgi:hypothetical protein